MTNAPGYPGAASAFNELRRKTNHEVVIVTNQYDGTEHYTLEWLGKHGIQPKNVIFEFDKTKAGCDVLVDDKIENLQSQIASGKMAIKIARPWNRRWEETTTKKNLVEAVELLKTL